MRKSVFILLTVFMACLLCKESGNRPDAPWKFTNETFLTRGGGNLLADQWQCEYVYNSNLSLTGVLQECEKARTSVSIVPARSPRVLACCVFINVLRHIRYFGRCRTRCKGAQKRFRCRTACRRPLRLPSAPAHYLAMRQENSQKAMHAVYSETIYTGHRRPGLFHSPS